MPYFPLFQPNDEARFAISFYKVANKNAGTFFSVYCNAAWGTNHEPST